MASTIYVISKEYLNPNETAKVIEKIAQRLGYDSETDYSQDYDIIDINIFKENPTSYVKVSVHYKSNYFNNTFNNLFNINGYGVMITVESYLDNPFLIPFLKETLNEFPELLVYNEEVPKGVGSYVFTKSHLENYSKYDSYAFFSNPPDDSNNMV